jgi:hypothetical protein
MTARALQPSDTAATIIHDAIAEYKSRNGLTRKNLSKQQRHEIAKAKISYVLGNLDEVDLRRTIERVLSEPSRDPLDIQAGSHHRPGNTRWR